MANISMSRIRRLFGHSFSKAFKRPPTKLYKYFSFDRSYWHEPATEGTLYLASTYQLQLGNDKEELSHNWNSSSYFFSKYKHHLVESYDRLFNSARVLCLSKVLKESCWDIFCPKSVGGICYEFDFDEFAKNSDINSGSVIYAERKIHNFPIFAANNVRERRVKHFLTKESAFTKQEEEELSVWLKSGEPKQLSHDHIVEELVFKKLNGYRFEREYRFIHPEKPMDSKVTPLQNSKLALSTLGLKLVRIHTSDVNRVREGLRKDSVKISIPRFLQPQRGNRSSKS